MLASSPKTISTHLSTAVSKISKQPDGTYNLTTPDGTSNFDTIILAAPYQFSNLEFEPELKHVPDEIPYVQLHVTLFASPHPLDPAAFNLQPGEKVPQYVLTTLPEGEDHGSSPKGQGSPGFFSISIVSTGANPDSDPPNRPEYIYKIFSAEEVDAAFLSRILGVGVPKDMQESEESIGVSPENGPVTWMYKKLWHSYPYEYPRLTFEELRLDEGVWYTAGIESFISTMETSALMGRNVARLVVHKWVEDEEGKIKDSAREGWEFEGLRGEEQQKVVGGGV